MSAFEKMKQVDLIDWYTLLVGLQHKWCDKMHLVEYSENYLLQPTDEIDGGLISIAAGASLSNDELISICVHFMEAQKKPLSQEKKDESLEKWRFAHLSSLLSSTNSDEEKINALQEIYSEFGFPEDMASCSVYSNDGVDPLDAARNVMQILMKKFT